MIALDLPLGFAPEAPDELARLAESAGLDGLWSAEAGHDPYLPLGPVATATSNLVLGTAIAVAFPRSPMAHAQVAWDLHRMSQGRFILGLGPQVKAHNERRYGVPGDRPAARLRDMVAAIRAIWRCWEEGEKPDYHGEFYQFSLMTPFFNPGPVGHGYPKILIAAVGETMLKVAGSVSDGVHVHPLHTRRYLEEVVLPVARGAAEAEGRDGNALEYVVPVMIATGKDDAAVAEAREAYRAQVAFYASTPTYRGVLDLHGSPEVADKLHGLSRRGEWAAMPELIDDELLNEICVCATWDNLGGELARRYDGLATRIMPYVPPDDVAQWGQIAKDLKAQTAGVG